MIAKGTTHNNGPKLAQYMTTGKETERAEFWQLVGFAAGDVREAFRSVHVMAEATRCEQPFFHVQVRNPDGEELTRDQWRRVADRIETKLGLTDQPRAIAFHVNEQTGHEHMHVAWSRIDAETMRAVPLPFFKERLKEVSRELEKTLDLTRVKNERDGPVLAPTRDEFEQARRLGVDIHGVRQTIRDCFERSDNGRSFEAALADRGLVLAQGARRDFVVIDHEGGMHALGKRILGVNAGQTRERLADLDRDQLPTVEHARSFIREQQITRDRTKAEPMRDPHREEMAWQDALAKAAIEKEKIERRFVESHPGRETPGSKEKGQGSQPPEHLKGIAADIWIAYHQSRDVNEFVDSLERTARLACVTKREADRSHREAAFAREAGRFAPVYREGEIVIVADPGRLHRREGEITGRRGVYQLNRYTTGHDRATIEKFLAPLDRSSLPSIEATKQIIQDRAAAFDLERQAFRDLSSLGVLKREKDTRPTGRLGREISGKDPSSRVVTRQAEHVTGKALEAVAELAAGAIETLANMFGATERTPEQIQAAHDAGERAAAAAEIDRERFKSEQDHLRAVEAQEAQKLDQERQRTYYERQRDGGRER
jgi:hypothetical protein